MFRNLNCETSVFRGEINAIVTHWLLNPDICPPLMPFEVFQKCRKLFGLPELTRQINNLVKKKQHQLSLDYIRNDIPFPPQKEPKFYFLDLFAGIGGFRIALQNVGGKCVFSSEWDKAAQKTYRENFGETPFGDINQFTGKNISDNEIGEFIPNHQVLAAGFPCQPFSRAGVSARNSLGQKTGFNCDVQGNLFFNIVRIAKVKRPDVLFLENVRNLKSHDKGHTFETIKRTIENELGYSFRYDIINANTRVPQNRERCYMVCFKNHKIDFSFPKFEGKPLPLGSILEKDAPEKYTISDRLWGGHIKRTERNIARGTGFTAFLADLNKPSNTLVARYGKDGKECLIPQEGKNPRKLTPLECARLQGFPDNFVLPSAAAPAYRQFGNAVAVPVVQEIAKSILKELNI
jgi:DNA (cytosine-5)-methyltransferase 1